MVRRLMGSWTRSLSAFKFPVAPLLFCWPRLITRLAVTCARPVRLSHATSAARELSPTDACWSQGHGGGRWVRHKHSTVSSSTMVPNTQVGWTYTSAYKQATNDKLRCFCSSSYGKVLTVTVNRYGTENNFTSWVALYYDVHCFLHKAQTRLIMSLLKYAR